MTIAKDVQRAEILRQNDMQYVKLNRILANSNQTWLRDINRLFAANKKKIPRQLMQHSVLNVVAH